MTPIEAMALRPPGFYRFLLDRGIPASFAIASFAIAIFSDVPPNLILVDGDKATAVMVLYGCVMTALIAIPGHHDLHRIALPLGVLAWAGRGGGFLALVLDGQVHLVAAVIERGCLLVTITLWHLAQARWYETQTVVEGIEQMARDR